MNDPERPPEFEEPLPGSPDHTRPEPERSRLRPDQYLETKPGPHSGSLGASTPDVAVVSDTAHPAQAPPAVGESHGVAADSEPAVEQGERSAAKKPRFNFAPLVPYRLRWSRVLDFEFTLWSPDEVPRVPEIKMTGREIYTKLLDGSAMWGHKDWISSATTRAVVIDTQEYYFSRELYDYNDAAECILGTMAMRLQEDRGSSDLLALHTALTVNEAKFYLLEDRSQLSTSPRDYANHVFFGASERTTPPTVRLYVFACQSDSLDEYFWPGTEESDLARAAVNYRHFFRASENGAHWAAWFALKFSEGEGDLKSLALVSSSNDALVQLMSLRRLNTALESHAKDESEQTRMLNTSLVVLRGQLRIIVVLLLAVLCVLVYRVVR